MLSRLDGPTLLQLLRTRAMTPEQAGAILAALSISVHKTPPPPDVISLPDLIHALVQSPGTLLPKHRATCFLALLESLPPGDGLCHGDFHPGNVIMTAEGPRLIDWTWARRAGPALDLGHCHVVLCELIPEPRRSGAAARAQCGCAVRVRAGGRHVSRGADGSDGVLLAQRPRLLPPRMGG